MKVLSALIVLTLLTLAGWAQSTTSVKRVSDEDLECGLTRLPLAKVELSVTGRRELVGQLGYKDLVVKYDGVARDIDYFLPSSTHPGRYIVGFIVQDWEEEQFRRNALQRLSISVTPRVKSKGVKVTVESVGIERK